MATPEDKDKLDQLLAKTEENNKMLHKMVRDGRIARAFRVIYYVIIIGSTISAYYYIQPYIDEALAVLKDPQKSTSGLIDSSLSKQIQQEAQKFIDSQKLR